MQDNGTFLSVSITQYVRLKLGKGYTYVQYSEFLDNIIDFMTIIIALQ